MDRMIKRRRALQAKALEAWDAGKITGLECIEEIIELEKIIPMDRSVIKGEENVNTQGPNNG